MAALRLLVIDSVSALLSPALGGLKQPLGHVLMLELARSLKALSTHHRLAVIVRSSPVVLSSSRSHLSHLHLVTVEHQCHRGCWWRLCQRCLCQR